MTEHEPPMADDEPPMAEHEPSQPDREPARREPAAAVNEPLITEPKLTRRTLAKGAVLAAGGAALHTERADAHRWWGRRPWRPDDDDDIALVNGNFLTLDGRDTRAGSVAIRGDRIVDVGRGRNVRGCKRTIDLRGATVVPGLIDSHQHFIRACHNPG